MKYHKRHLGIILAGMLVISTVFIILPTKRVNASPPYDGHDLALAILTNSSQSALNSSQYVDSDPSGQHLQAKVVSALGLTAFPTDGSTFIVLSTGKAGAVPVMTESGSLYHTERGTWFGLQRPKDDPKPWIFDEANLTLQLQVPPYMHYLRYDQQFFTTEYPDYNHPPTIYNDKLTITVNSPHQGITTYVTDVKNGNFTLTADDIPGTGFDIFAKTYYAPHNPTDPADVDWIDQIPGTYNGKSCADAGATNLMSPRHPVSPNEIITVTFDITDADDNQFDSAVFIDNLHFSGIDINATKTVQDLTGSPSKPGDALSYTITITNNGNKDQHDDHYSNESEDVIPDNTTYVPGSAHASSGSIAYNAVANKIIWNGDIPAKSSVALTFNVTVNQNLRNGTIISNQGTVHWDKNEDGTNEAINHTNFANVTVICEAPTNLTEDFHDDPVGRKATEYYQGNMWFETSQISGKSNFEVASDYRYSTPRSFKTKLRASCSPQYWNYTVSQFNSNIEWWEVWFACGNASEPYDLSLDFKNANGNSITRIQFNYIYTGIEPPMNYVIKLTYSTPGGTHQLRSIYPDGYLYGWNSEYTGWYKLRIERNGATALNYTLYQKQKNGFVEHTDKETGSTLGASLASLSRVEWRSTKNPVVCPMIFWDEHTIGLTSN